MGALFQNDEDHPAPRFSVVIPHLNEPRNLRRCLEAIYASRSSHESFEVIVADNGSAVPPLSVCAGFPSARLVIEKRPGPGPARNTAATLARGEFICFIDCDCFIAPDYFDVCAAFFDGHPEVGFVGGSIGIWSSQLPKLKPVEAYEAAFSYRAEMFVRRDRFAATGNMVVRRDVFDAVGPFAGIGRHEDREWGQRAVSIGYRIDYLHDARVLTPGCGDFAELAKRIERHVAHDFAELGPGWRARAKWLGTAGLMLLSPPAGIGEILRCEQITGVKLRLQVFACLCRVRAYRAWLMVDALRGRSAEKHLATWNRPDGAEASRGSK